MSDEEEENFEVSVIVSENTSSFDKLLDFTIGGPKPRSISILENENVEPDLTLGQLFERANKNVTKSKFAIDTLKFNDNKADESILNNLSNVTLSQLSEKFKNEEQPFRVVGIFKQPKTRGGAKTKKEKKKTKPKSKEEKKGEPGPSIRMDKSSLSNVGNTGGTNTVNNQIKANKVEAEGEFNIQDGVEVPKEGSVLERKIDGGIREEIKKPRKRMNGENSVVRISLYEKKGETITDTQTKRMYIKNGDVDIKGIGKELFEREEKMVIFDRDDYECGIITHKDDLIGNINNLNVGIVEENLYTEMRENKKRRRKENDDVGLRKKKLQKTGEEGVDK